MKINSTHKLLPTTFGLLAMVLVLLSSCDKMNDIQREYAEREEKIYLGKVDSIEYFPGFGRVKLTWYVGADPKIDRTIIYWNMRQDSIVKEFVRSAPGVQKDSIILDNLPEGSLLLELRNVNDEGQSSLYSSISVSVWGVEFGSGLRARRLAGFDYDYDQSIYRLTLSESTPGDNVVYSQIAYTNTLGQEKTVRIEKDASEVELVNFPDGGTFNFRTVFFLPDGIDTVYNEYSSFKAPAAVSETGTKISFTGAMESKYFDRNGTHLYEWNAAGDLLVYTIDAAGSLEQIETHPSIVPRDAYRDFFFYDDDKFIGIGTGNAVSMHRIDGGELTTVMTPTGAPTFGAGFGFEKFIPTRGYFFSIAAETGEMKTWLAQNNATWGSPNGTTVGTGFMQYEPLMLFNHQTLLGVDADGYLWSIPISVNGTLGSRSRIGSGWDRFKKMVSIGTQLLCMEENGDFYLFDEFNTTDNFWIVD